MLLELLTGPGSQRGAEGAYSRAERDESLFRPPLTDIVGMPVKGAGWLGGWHKFIGSHGYP